VVAGGGESKVARVARRMWRKDATRLARLIVATLISLTVDGTAAGSCSSAKLCCQGRDSGCVIQKESPNAIIESPRDKPCYCDHACLKLADCCDDFKETCGGTWRFRTEGLWVATGNVEKTIDEVGRLNKLLQKNIILV